MFTQIGTMVESQEGLVDRIDVNMEATLDMSKVQTKN